jgi:hypothetical protein
MADDRAEKLVNVDPKFPSINTTLYHSLSLSSPTASSRYVDGNMVEDLGARLRGECSPAKSGKYKSFPRITSPENCMYNNI